MQQCNLTIILLIVFRTDRVPSARDTGVFDTFKQMNRDPYIWFIVKDYMGVKKGMK